MPVSVVMPAKNAAAFLGEAIESVLTQGRDVIEIIVVDDGSSDDTRSIVRAFEDRGVRLLDNQGAGVSAARNTGARAANGDWLMFLDADDRLRPSAVAALVGPAQAAPDAVAIYGNYDRIDGQGRPIGRRRWLRHRPKPSGRVLERLAAGNFIVNGGVMIVRSRSFAEVGGFDETLKYCEDWHCWCRLAALGEFRFIPDFLLDYRQHRDNTMSATVRSPQDFLPAAERVFCDRSILAKLPAGSAAALRDAAELHLLTYAATQAVHFRRYRQAFSYLLMVAQRSVLAVPRATMSLGLAYVGI
jgi:glycosyltransferase involved in cell wall biosynthesis